MWWTSQADAESIGERGIRAKSYRGVPKYIRDEFGSRYGRPGRGRLWIPDGIPVSSVAWADERPTCRAASECGGIVFRAEDLAYVHQLPGFVTDCEMNEVKRG